MTFVSVQAALRRFDQPTYKFRLTQIVGTTNQLRMRKNRRPSMNNNICPTCGDEFPPGTRKCPLCSQYVVRPTAPKREFTVYCRACKRYSVSGLRKGSLLIEIFLYFIYIAPGVIYSIWRRSGPATVCPVCYGNTLIPASATSGDRLSNATVRDEIDCPHCAEKILAKAKLCKHCGMDIKKGSQEGP